MIAAGMGIGRGSTAEEAIAGGYAFRKSSNSGLEGRSTMLDGEAALSYHVDALRAASAAQTSPARQALCTTTGLPPCTKTSCAMSLSHDMDDAPRPKGPTPLGL